MFTVSLISTPNVHWAAIAAFGSSIEAHRRRAFYTPLKGFLSGTPKAKEK